LAWKGKQFEAWQDDIEGERGCRGCFSRHFFAFDTTIILRPNYVWCFRGVTLLSCDYSRVGWITLSFEVLPFRKILDLSCGFCVARHFLFCRMGGYPDSLAGTPS
jgi:hypothetical protein